MRLLSLEVNGIRRLLDCKCHLGGKLTAVVGPNEAGKSTLLFALAQITTSDAISAANLSRVSRPTDDQTVIAADWEIEDRDHAALSEFELAEAPLRMRVAKKPTGYRTITVTPSPRRNPQAYQEAVAPLRRFLESGGGQQVARRDPEGDDEPELGDDLEWVLNDLNSQGWVNWSEEDVHRLTSAVERLRDLVASPNSLASRAASALQRVVESAGYQDPRDAVWRVLLDRVPPCVEFEQPDRELSSSYDLAAIDPASPPRAFANLADLAQLDLVALAQHVNAADMGMAATLLRQANDRLEQFYREKWRQSDLRVVLDRDGLRLDILIEEIGGSTYVLSERSDGLRAFVALTAFLARHDVERPVLLIDEAETHLHYDAQRDLVDVLLEQEVAQQVIYTTHSPGCLPPDLGTGVRAVVPVPERPGVSETLNEFWSSSVPGFSPLLLMMGAGAAAFTTTRAALLVEGPSDMILLPTLIREALHLPTLPYHIAPGLSATAPDRFAEFDFVAARLVYVVDGDDGGEAIRASLTSDGIPDDHVLSLGGRGSGLTLEDLVTKASFLRALNSELAVSGRQQVAALPDGNGRFNIAKEACRQLGVVVPSKVALAGRLIWQDPSPELDRAGRRALQQLHKSASRLLTARR